MIRTLLLILFYSMLLYFMRYIYGFESAVIGGLSLLLSYVDDIGSSNED